MRRSYCQYSDTRGDGGRSQLIFVSVCDVRVKTVDSVNVDDYSVVVTASNDGFIKMWKIHLKEVCCVLILAFWRTCILC